MQIMQNWFSWIWVNPRPSNEDHLTLSTYTISEQSDQPKPRKQSKPSFLALFCINYADNALLIMRNMSDVLAKSLTTFNTIQISNIESLDVFVATTDQSEPRKMSFYAYWLSQYGK